MAVDVERRLDARMAEPLLDRLRVLPGRDEERRVRVSQVVEPHGGEAGRVEVAPERAVDVVGIERAARGSARRAARPRVAASSEHGRRVIIYLAGDLLASDASGRVYPEARITRCRPGRRAGMGEGGGCAVKPQFETSNRSPISCGNWSAVAFVSLFPRYPCGSAEQDGKMAEEKCGVKHLSGREGNA
jgi:hypothetical protein